MNRVDSSYEKHPILYHLVLWAVVFVSLYFLLDKIVDNGRDTIIIKKPDSCVVKPNLERCKDDKPKEKSGGDSSNETNSEQSGGETIAPASPSAAPVQPATPATPTPAPSDSGGSNNNSSPQPNPQQPPPPEPNCTVELELLGLCI